MKYTGLHHVRTKQGSAFRLVELFLSVAISSRGLRVCQIDKLLFPRLKDA
jgi:hypothetical protein